MLAFVKYSVTINRSQRATLQLSLEFLVESLTGGFPWLTSASHTYYYCAYAQENFQEQDTMGMAASAGECRLGKQVMPKDCSHINESDAKSPDK